MKIHLVTEVCGAQIFNYPFDTHKKAAERFKELVLENGLDLPKNYDKEDSCAFTDEYEIRVEYNIEVE